ncbi:MAG TPA: helix-turn-helix transcriptional regulator [Acidimicrobiales bacterium]|nr:helix-turn-helix transcriptional regulator [Acidimicrobiales bacterium]
MVELHAVADFPLHVRLRERRRELGLSSESAAALCAVTQSAYSRWENGKQSPSRRSLEGVAGFLGVPLAEAARMWAEDSAPDDEVDQLRQEVARLMEAVAELQRRIPPPDMP